MGRGGRVQPRGQTADFLRFPYGSRISSGSVWRSPDRVLNVGHDGRPGHPFRPPAPLCLLPVVAAFVPRSATVV